MAIRSVSPYRSRPWVSSSRANTRGIRIRFVPVERCSGTGLNIGSVTVGRNVAREVLQSSPYERSELEIGIFRRSIRVDAEQDEKLLVHIMPTINAVENTLMSGADSASVFVGHTLLVAKRALWRIDAIENLECLCKAMCAIRATMDR